MLVKILIDADLYGSGMRPVVRFMNAGNWRDSDDVKDKLVRRLLEEVGCGSGFLSLHYDPDGDGILRAAGYEEVLVGFMERFSGVGSVSDDLRSAVSGLRSAGVI